MSDRISRFSVPELTDLADDVRERILGVQEKAGFIPNVFLMLAHRPAEFRAFFDYHDALMEKNEGLTKAEREMIVVATSGAGNCLYCVVAHGAVLRIRAKNARVADQLATNYRKAEITDRQRAMLDFAMKLSTNGGAVEDADMAALREHGFDDEAIWDIGAITAFFAMSNRLVHLTGTPPNEPFYLMGRLPKGS
ncbi:MAG: peroxidase-related enzyme [Denitromonas halophila]|nr:MAG: peroxidase-related enzyme [Denitromonas halophila]TVT75413.1 MAG: peroxidase-related enzyme [Denitromonas halophila]